MWTQAEPKFDGLIYGSSQLSNGANNIVLFPHAIDVAGYDQETPDHTAELSRSYDEEHEDVVTFDEPDGKASAVAIKIPSATLRLLVDETVVSRVKAIDYDCQERRVYRLRMPRTPSEF